MTGVLGRRWTLEEIQPLMGHAAIAMTQRYAHIGDDALKKAARETAPRGELRIVESKPMGAREFVKSVLRRIVSRVA